MEVILLKQFLQSNKNLNDFSKEYDMSANAIRARISKQSHFLIKSKIIDIKKYLPYPNQYLYNMKANREYWLMAIDDYEQSKNNVNNMKQCNQDERKLSEITVSEFINLMKTLK